MYKIVEFGTDTEVAPGDLVFAGRGVPWEVKMDPDEIRRRLHPRYFMTAPPANSKYLPFMPVKDHGAFVSMSEGATPLVRSRHVGPSLGVDLYFKSEFQNPTGSFKDRGSAVEITVARELGAKGVCVASTGNMAASCSCYAAAAGVPCFVFVPEDTPASKLSQTISYGGRIVQVKGTYNDAARLAEEAARTLGLYLAGDYAFRIEGQKTAAFEIADQLLFRPPAVVMVPVGCGTNIAAYAKGFREYAALGFIDRLPTLVAVQAEGAASVVRAFETGERDVLPLTRTDTLASAIAVSCPIDGAKALEAVYGTGGDAVSVSDREILDAQLLLSREEGVFVEPSAATSVAALVKRCAEGRRPDGVVVCVLTGDGLKDPQAVLKVAVRPPTIRPDVENFLALYRGKFFEAATVSFLDKDAVVFAVPPTEAEAAAVLGATFGRTFTDPEVAGVVSRVRRFLLKGKPVGYSDLQDVVQDVVQDVGRDPDGAARPGLRVEDFEVVTGKDRKPSARVVISLGDAVYEAKESGVGPVDAVIRALRAACRGAVTFSLFDYEVAIRSFGTDAVVSAELKLSRDGSVSVGKGASPDIIQASIEAFEQAYNSLPVP